MPERVAVVTAAIVERPLCRACIAESAAIPPAKVNAALATIGGVLALEIEDDGRCCVCATTGTVVSLRRLPVKSRLDPAAG
jgi:hypothetical protein